MTLKFHIAKYLLSNYNYCWGMVCGDQIIFV